MKFLALASLGALALHSANAEVIGISPSSQLADSNSQGLSSSQSVSNLRSVDSTSKTNPN